MTKISTSLIVFVLIFYASSSWALTGKVINVADGDTITVLANDRTQTVIRLYGIDTPEKAQAFGNVAKKLTARLCAGKMVEVTGYDIDKYGRTVGVVTVGELNVNQAILEAGLGWQYRKYCKADFCDGWLKIEEQARNAGIGLWRDASPTPPWEWRKGGQGANALVSVPGTYHGNSKSHVFHQASCKAFNCKNCVISFESRESALRAGYRPCGSCRP